MGIVSRIQRLGYGQRIVVFILLMVGALLLLVALTVFLILLSINSTPRSVATALQPDISVREFVALPGDDAYPSSVTVDANGTVYTASYATGTVWTITPTGELNEIPGTKDQLASVTGLVAPASGDVKLYLVDRETSDPRQKGGMIWKLTSDNTLSKFAEIDDETGFISPHDVTLDASGSVYATDRGRREIWRWNVDGTGGALWWKPDDEKVIPTGLAFDALHNAIIVTDSEANIIYQIPAGAASAVAQVIYQYTGEASKPSFDGVAVAADGTLYITALEQNGVATLRTNNQGKLELVYLAGSFRSPSDIALAPDGDHLYVTNFDSTPLVVPEIRPQLPFALDVLTLGIEAPLATATAG